MTSTPLQLLADLRGEVEVVAADLTDPASLEPHLAGVDAVFLSWPSAGRKLGRELRWAEMPRGEAHALLARAFGNAAFADGALDGWAAFADRPEQVTDTVAAVTGHPARSYAEWVADHVDAFR